MVVSQPGRKPFSVPCIDWVLMLSYSERLWRRILYLKEIALTQLQCRLCCFWVSARCKPLAWRCMRRRRWPRVCTSTHRHEAWNVYIRSPWLGMIEIRKSKYDVQLEVNYSNFLRTPRKSMIRWIEYWNVIFEPRNCMFLHYDFISSTSTTLQFLDSMNVKFECKLRSMLDFDPFCHEDAFCT